MGEYIKREAVFEKCGWYNLYSGGSVCAVSKKEVAEIPAADVVEVVRCRDCIYFDDATVNRKGFVICPAIGMEITDDDFCSYGERRESDVSKPD